MNINNIEAYLHCGKCLSEWKNRREIRTKQSPRDYSKIECGWTKKGIQIWCVRHSCNILHIDFEGQKHPVDTTAKSSHKVKKEKHG